MHPKNIMSKAVYNIIVVGGGAAGMAAAVSAAAEGQTVLLLEKNDRLGKKLFLTGHGRCNVTNRADVAGYQSKIWRNPKFVLSALNRFGPQDLERFLADNGTRLKEEDSGRMFPVSDHSSDIIRAFRRALERENVAVGLSAAVRKLEKDGNVFVVATEDGTFRAMSVILATGGLSYPSTGSTGDGFAFARQAGHSIVPLQGALVGLAADPDRFSKLSGLTLKGAGFTLESGGKVLAREEGDVLFTHHGLSGPAVFRASCAVPASVHFPLTGLIDLRPQLSQEEVEAKILQLAQGNSNKEVRTLLEAIVPKRLAGLVASQAHIPAGMRMNQLSREQRRQLAQAVHSFSVPITGLRPVSEAIITSGGVPVREISPKTMESRLVPGLFFAGEMIDVSAMTGGYNLQIAFSTGWAAGAAAAAYCREAEAEQQK